MPNQTNNKSIRPAIVDSNPGLNMPCQGTCDISDEELQAMKDEIESELRKITESLASLKKPYLRFGSGLQASNGTIRYSTQQINEDQQ